MEKTIDSPVCVYRNRTFETTTEAELKLAQKALQKLLDKWMLLGLGPCKDISGLIMRPRIMYDQAVNDLLKVPESEGPFKLDKNKYKDQFTLPDPAELLEARNEALKLSFCASSELWNVSGDQVVLDEAEGQALIDSQSIYLSDPAKIELVENVTKLCELMNKVNSAMAGQLLPPEPHVSQFCMGKFLLTQKSYPGPYEMSVDPAFLKELIRRQ
jgi:hypothetical protein